MTAAQLQAATGCTAQQVKAIVAPMNETFKRYNINTPFRQAHFLAQIAHESCNFRYTVEIASGEAYEGRKDLGNTQPGDGPRFKGRGWIQLTGRANYQRYGNARGVNFEANPDLVATQYFADVAGWFWTQAGLNSEADEDDLLTITKRINGGLNGIEDRKARLARAKKALGI